MKIIYKGLGGVPSYYNSKFINISIAELKEKWTFEEVGEIVSHNILLNTPLLP